MHGIMGGGRRTVVGGCVCKMPPEKFQEPGKLGFCYLCEVERPRKMWFWGFVVKIFSLILRACFFSPSFFFNHCFLPHLFSHGK